jgi:hypothetical protein
VRTKYVDFNGLLMAANFVVVALLISAYGEADYNNYVDQNSVVLAVVLAIQTHVALLIERRRRDPFVILLALEMIFYHTLRIYTLILAPYSVVFDRFKYTPSDSNYALVFIIIANLYLYAGLFAVRIKDSRPISASGWRPASPTGAIVLIVVAIAFTYLSVQQRDQIPRAFEFLALFLSQSNILLMALLYYFLYRKALSRKVGFAIGVLILADMAMYTLLGSRSTVVVLVENCLLVVLAISGCVRIKRSQLWIGAIIMPLLVVALVGSFAIGTYNRAAKENAVTLDLSEAIRLTQEYGTQSDANTNLALVLAAVFSRIGYFDFSAEVIAHRAQYASVINPYAYGKSIVDNLLTPGFDIYDQPKTANALQFLYRNIGPVSKEALAETYQSDQLGIYGEFYDLFGYASLPLMFLTTYGFKRLYARLRDARPYMLAMKRIIVLFLFTEVMRSYGLDWTICEAVPLVAAMYMYGLFFAGRPAAAPANAPVTRTLAAPL